MRCASTMTNLEALTQREDDITEGRSEVGDGVPTGGHEAVDRWRTVLRSVESTSVGHKLHHLVVTVARIWHVPEREHLP